MSAKYSRNKMMRKRNHKRLRTELRIIYDELLNLAEGELDSQFDAAFERGELLEFHGTEEDMKHMLVDAMNQYFGLDDGDELYALPGA